ncbi:MULTISPECIES: hypothetical protein [unclassified Vibrio]
MAKKQQKQQRIKTTSNKQKITKLISQKSEELLSIGVDIEQQKER